MKPRCQICRTEVSPDDPRAPDAPDDLVICSSCWHCCQELGLALGEALCRAVTLIKAGTVPGNGSAS